MVGKVVDSPITNCVNDIDLTLTSIHQEVKSNTDFDFGGIVGYVGNTTVQNYSNLRNNGDILYNSRAYFGDGKRYLATSTDGGATFGEFRTDDFLEEEKRMGCNASFLRVERDELGADLAGKFLPENSDAITIFVNPRAETRRNLTACVSFDDGKSWKVAKTFYEDACAYSSLVFSASEKLFYLMYEKGTVKPYSLGISAAEFDLEWLLS
jgi:sialidase-1